MVEKPEISITMSGEIKLAHVDSATSTQAQQLFTDEQVDLLVTANPTSGSVIYPEQIVHQISDLQSADEWLARLSSKNRNDLKRAAKRCAEAGLEIKIVDEISADEFSEWYRSYERIIPQLKYGRLKISADWLTEKSDKIPAILTYDETGRLIAGTILKEFSEKISRSYAWADESAKTLGFPTLEVKLLADYAIRKGKKSLSFGKDTNLYGGHLSLGLLHFKQRWGTEPLVPENAMETMKYIEVNPASSKTFSFFYQVGDEIKLLQHNCA